MKRNKIIALGIPIIILPFFYTAYLHIDVNQMPFNIVSMVVVIAGVLAAIAVGVSDREESQDKKS